jgi:NAD(P)H-dependent FMN reductase
MKISVIAGSHRPNSQSGKVADWIASRLSQRDLAVTATIDLGAAPLPLWDETAFTADPSPLNLAWQPVSEELAACDGVVVVTPEWHGMAPPALKNLLLLCKTELAHKPGLIVGVSASQGGTYPVVELRVTGFKNNRICWIPDHVILRNVSKILNETAAEDEAAEAAAKGRLEHALGLLVEYAKALRAVRASGAFDAKAYPFGM